MTMLVAPWGSKFHDLKRVVLIQYFWMFEKLYLGNLSYNLYPTGYQGHKVIFKVITLEKQ